MDIRCGSCGAPVEVKPAETIVTCVFCRQAIQLDVAPADSRPQEKAWSDYDLNDPNDNRAQVHRAMLEARRIRAELAQDPGAASAMSDPVPRSRSGVAVLSVIGSLGIVVAAGAFAFWSNHQASSVDPTARPTAGVLDLAKLPTDAPSRRTVRVTGAVDATALGSSCRGSVERAPTVVLRVREAALVTLETMGGSNDPTLGLRASDGTSFCDDDSGARDNARLTLLLGPGSYPVWVGSRSRDVASTLTLMVEQARAPGVTAPGAVVAMGEDASPDIALLSRLTPTGGMLEVPATPGRLVSRGISGGEIRTSGIDPACRGFIPAAPQASFQLTEATSLSITTVSGEDLTLLVRGSDGRVRCDDDSGDGNNGFLADTFPPGRVDVWVGRRHDSTVEPFTLNVSHEPMPTGVLEFGFAIESMPELGVVDASTLQGVWSKQGIASGQVRADGIGPHCHGRLPVVATVALNVSTATAVTVSTSSHGDLLLAIRHPDGSWTCDSGRNDPRITASFAPGDHRVWVGPVHANRADPFELRISASGAAQRTASRPLHEGKSAKSER